MKNSTLTLSPEISLVYVLRESGCHGRLTGGKIERVGEQGLKVFDGYDSLIEYISGEALRSWCVIDLNGVPIEEWNSVLPEDIEDVLSYALNQYDRSVGAGA